LEIQACSEALPHGLGSVICALILQWFAGISFSTSRMFTALFLGVTYGVEFLLKIEYHNKVSYSMKNARVNAYD
jgi:glucose uptake protein GlcU